MEDGHNNQNGHKKFTLISPYIALVSLVAPNTAVIAYVRPTPGHAALMFTSWFLLAKWLLGFMLVMATICAAVYMVRAQGKGGRFWVAATLVISWAGFLYAAH